MSEQGENELTECSYIALLADFLLPLELFVRSAGLFFACGLLIYPEQLDQSIEFADVYPYSQVPGLALADVDRVEVKAAMYKFLLNRKAFEGGNQLHDDLLELPWAHELRSCLWRVAFRLPRDVLGQ